MHVAILLSGISSISEMRRTIFGIILLGGLVHAHTQGHQLQVLIQGLPDGMVYLSQFNTDSYEVIDSIGAINGSFYFILEPHQPAGMYKIDLQNPYQPKQPDRQDGPGYIEFIWGEESFEIYADYRDIPGTVSFSNSEENRVLGLFREFEVAYERKMNAMYTLIDLYPPGDRFYDQAASHFLQLQEDRDEYIVSLTDKYPGLFATRIIDSYRTVTLQPGLQGDERIAFLREHYFERAPINDPVLLHAPVYTGKIIEYLRLYRGQDYTFSEQEDAFIEAVDMIMANVSGDPDLRSFAVEYMLEGFESFGMEKVQTYIVDTYVDETCATDVVELAVERVKGYRKMAEGQTGADILVRNVDNQVLRLSEVDADYTLLVFWATYCEHCREMIPEIHEWYDTERPQKVEVFAVSIDTVKSDWVRFIRDVHPPWINSHEPMGWEGQSAEDYNIYATPTMFLLDSDLTIVARPFNMRELRRTFRKLTR